MITNKIPVQAEILNTLLSGPLAAWMYIHFTCHCLSKKANEHIFLNNNLNRTEQKTTLLTSQAYRYAVGGTIYLYLYNDSNRVLQIQKVPFALCFFTI